MRLPRDWLGPREELVPFGPRATASAAGDGAGAAADELPPSADDFWGERAGAVHDALQAPAGDLAAAAVFNDGESANGASASAVASQRTRLRSLIRRHRLRLAATAAALGVAGAVVIGLAFGVTGSTRHDTNGAWLDIAAVTSGVSQILKLDLPRIVRARPHVVTSGRARPIHRAARPHIVATQSHKAPPQRSAPPAPVIAAATPASPPPTEAPSHSSSVVSDSSSGSNERSISRSSPAARSRSSSAAVSPTGESGALGPIQSPNG